ncbi:MAG: pilus assembly protein PilM [Candidatus Omnitrophota bacterium]
MAKGIGVYIGRNEVMAVSAIRTGTGPQIQAFAIEPFTSDGPQESSVGKELSRLKKMSPEARAILKALEKIQAPHAYVNVAVSPLQVVTRHFIMPSVPKKDEPGVVSSEATRYIPFKISELSMDYSARLTHKNITSVTVTAIRNEVLDAYLEDLRSVSAKVLVIEPVYNAVARAFSALKMGSKAQGHGFVVLQSNGNVNVTLTSKGIVYLSRDFLLSGKLEEDKMRFHSELKASMEYFYKLTGGESIGQIFLAGSGGLKIWVEHLEHAFNYTIRFDVVNLPKGKDLPAEEELHGLLVPFGLAIRSLGYRSPLGDVQLLPKQERRSDPVQLLVFLAIECFLVLVLFAGIRLAIFQPYLMRLENQKNSILGPLDQEFPAYASRTTDDLTSEKVQLGSKLAQLNGFLEKRSASVTAFMKALGQGLPQSISLDYVALEDGTEGEASEVKKGKKRLNLRGICYLGNAEKETETVTTWIKALSGKKIMEEFFAEMKIEEIKREKYQNRDITRFRALGE